MDFFKQGSLRVKLLIVINALIASVFILGGVSFINHSIAKDSDFLSHRMAQMADTLSVPVAKYVWDMNNDALSIMAKKVMEDGEIHYVAIYDEDGDKVIPESGAPSKDEKIAKVGLKTPDGKFDLGFLIIGYSLKKINDSATSLVYIFIASMIVFMALINLILHFLLKGIISKLNAVTKTLSECGVSVREEGEAAFSYSEDVNTNTINTAHAADATASAIHEINSMMDMNVDKINAVTSLTKESESQANRCKDYLSELEHSMEEISKNNDIITKESENNNKKISDIVEIMTKIEEKTKVIDSIVFQTKLLSFNASVEAARAGEHGKGFSVVSEEMGSLSKHIKDASAEISEIVSESIKKVEAMVKEFTIQMKNLMDSNKGKINMGLSKADGVRDALSLLVEKVSDVNENISTIKSASSELAHGVKNISDSISEIKESTDSNSGLTEKTLSSTATMKDVADSLFNSLSELEKIVHGAKK